MSSLKSPFPYHGSKSRWTKVVWSKFGNVDRYIEPFAGSLAMLLSVPAGDRVEIVADTNCYIANFWRSVKFEPDSVALFSANPSITCDLISKNKYISEWVQSSKDKLFEDPYFYDAEIAGWWCWGIANWIGFRYGLEFSNKVQHVRRRDDGQGVMAQRKGLRGVNGTRDDYVESLKSMFWALQDRLLNVYIINRDWKCCTTRSALPNDVKNIGIFLDPPYITDSRSKLYQSDLEGSSNDVARESYDWAVD